MAFLNEPMYSTTASFDGLSWQLAVKRAIGVEEQTTSCKLCGKSPGGTLHARLCQAPRVKAHDTIVHNNVKRATQRILRQYLKTGLVDEDYTPFLGSAGPPGSCRMDIVLPADAFPVTGYDDPSRQLELPLMVDVTCFEAQAASRAQKTAADPELGSFGSIGEQGRKLLEAMLAMAVSSAQSDWDRWINHIAFAHNSHSDRERGCPPFLLVMRKEPRRQSSAMVLHRRVHAELERKRIMRGNVALARAFNLRSEPERVLSRKMLNQWVGPWRVTAVRPVYHEDMLGYARYLLSRNPLAAPAPRSMITEDDVTWTSNRHGVEAVVGHKVVRGRPGKSQYLVRWEGAHVADTCQWEAARLSLLDACEHATTEYWNLVNAAGVALADGGTSVVQGRLRQAQQRANGGRPSLRLAGGKYKLPQGTPLLVDKYMDSNEFAAPT
ncbi:hypothetical protein JKP88DRAFT_277637 [Tribonema minus]|uniref:Chromo domain-containing protein n=1 Tax=Tribonema minus TaxID=303371 RepID=A0A836CEZ8_9STRA|nr:hypothetical protein JKP88DRAFT_277637 [Tribonema minus]